MNNNIGVFGFATLHAPGGIPAVINAEIEDSRPGVDGYDYMSIGFRSDDFTVQTVSHFNTLTQANDAIKNYCAIVGTFQNITIGETSYSQVRIRNIRTMSPQRMLASTTGQKYRVTVEWTMKLSI